MKYHPSPELRVWALFIVVVVCLTGKCAVWHIQFFWDKQIPLLGCLAASLLPASFVLISRRRPWWILAVLLLTNMWLFANFAYERAWGQMLSMDMVRMAGNLRGFESSVLMYFHRDMLYWLLVPDVVCIAGVALWRTPEKRSWRAFVAVVVVFLLIIPMRQKEYYEKVYERRTGYNNHTGFAHWWNIHEPLFNLFSWSEDAAYDAFMFQVPQDWARQYVRQYGIATFGPALCAYDIRYRSLERSVRSETVTLTPEQQQTMEVLTGPEPDFTPSRSLVLVLVESLESWAVDYPLADGYVMPNLHKFIHSHKVWYSPQMYCQLAYGGSSDGQLMAVTGLLPVHQGVTVALYGEQQFPNYAHFFPESITLNPSPGTWKQHVVNPNYGIRQLEESDSIRDDAGIFRRLNTIDLSVPTFVLAITVSSHVPFSKAEDVELALSEDMPVSMAKYLKCMHYVDEQLATFLNRVDTDPAVAAADIVITGDHTIFYSQDWHTMQDYVASKDIASFFSEEGCNTFEGSNTTCLMLYSPGFTESVFCREPTYQMDIYPTVLHMIGCDAPAWKGVGFDWLGSEPRLLGAGEAGDLSDRLIRMRYFE